jgi:hypothetical protein
MGHPLTGSIEKWNRAMVHINEYKTATRNFIKDDAYGIEVKLDADGVQNIVFGRVYKEPPTLPWATIIGDVVNNLRSSLDYIAWELTILQNPVPPEPLERKWRNIGFPIVTNRDLWEDRFNRALWGRLDMEAVFKALQPFETGQNAPDNEPLAVLDKLWNIDKHRHPHLTQCIIGTQGIRAAIRDSVPRNNRIPEGIDYPFQWVNEHAPGPFEDGTELARFVSLVPIPLGDVNVEADLVFDVAFDEGTPAKGGRVVETLWMLQKTVYELIGRFKPEFP